jgi:hypothetical protein
MTEMANGIDKMIAPDRGAADHGAALGESEPLERA